MQGRFRLTSVMTLAVRLALGTAQAAPVDTVAVQLPGPRLGGGVSCGVGGGDGGAFSLPPG